MRAPNQYLLTFMLWLKPAQSVAAAEQAVRAVQPDLLAGMNVPRMAEEPIHLVPAGNGADRYRFRWSYQQPVVAVFAAAALALFVAFANIANLMFARASARIHEISVRLALGAGRARLARQVVSESAVLAGAGLLVGLLVAAWTIGLMQAFLANSWAIDTFSQGATLTVRPLFDDVAASIAQERLLAMLSGLFAILALALAGLGLYGLMSHVVTRRANEIGIRMALGAAPGHIVRLVLGRALTFTGLGVAIGTLGGLWASGLVSSLLFGLGARDVGTFVVAGFVLMALGLFAAWLPARSAAAIDPAVTLRLN